MKWVVARITNINRKKNILEIYSRQLNVTMTHSIPSNLNLELNEMVRIAVDILPYKVKIVMITKYKGRV